MEKTNYLYFLATLVALSMDQLSSFSLQIRIDFFSFCG